MPRRERSDLINYPDIIYQDAHHWMESGYFADEHVATFSRGSDRWKKGTARGPEEHAMMLKRKFFFKNGRPVSQPAAATRGSSRRRDRKPKAEPISASRRQSGAEAPGNASKKIKSA